MDLTEFKGNWVQLAATETFTHTIDTLSDLCRTSDSLQARLVHNNIFSAGRDFREDGEVLLFAAKTLKNYVFLMELRMTGAKAVVMVKASVPQLAQHFVQAVNFLLSTSF